MSSSLIPASRRRRMCARSGISDGPKTLCCIETAATQPTITKTDNPNTTRCCREPSEMAIAAQSGPPNTSMVENDNFFENAVRFRFFRFCFTNILAFSFASDFTRVDAFGASQLCPR